MRLRMIVSALLAATMTAVMVVVALKRPTMWWASGLFTLEVTLLSAASTLALTRSGRLRSGCAGFAICGLIYMHTNYFMAAFKQRYVYMPMLIEAGLLAATPFINPDANTEDFLEKAQMNCYVQIVFCTGALVFASLGGAFGWLVGGRASARTEGK